MNTITHLLTSWVLANGPELDRRDRIVITVAGAAPDLDGLGVVAELATRHTETPLLWWSAYHHVLGHNVAFGLLVLLAALAAARRRLVTAAVAVAAFHVHLLSDLLGSRGPDGDDWPIPYLFPFDSGFELRWSGQWALNAWPNIAFTLVLVAITLYLAWKRGSSVVELVSVRADQAVVRTLRDRFGKPGPSR